MPDNVSVGEVLQELLDQMDREELRDYMTNAEIANWMSTELHSRGVSVHGGS